jgi:hypothetical protein
MANFYVLQGKPNTGKTTTITILRRILEMKYRQPLSPITYTPSNNLKDEDIILPNIDGKKVGITTRGDDDVKLKRDITNFITHGCDIIFCACHPGGKSYTCVTSFTGHTIDFTQQTEQHNTFNNIRHQSNTCMAFILVNKAGL